MVLWELEEMCGKRDQYRLRCSILHQPFVYLLKGNVCTHRHTCTHTFTHMHSFTDTYGSHLRDGVRVGFTGTRMLVVPRQPPGTVTTLAKFPDHGLAPNLTGLETGFCPQRKRTWET